MVSKYIQCVFLHTNNQHLKGSIASIKYGLARFLSRKNIVLMIGVKEDAEKIVYNAVLKQNVADLAFVKSLITLELKVRLNQAGNIYENINNIRIHKEIKKQYDKSIDSLISIQLDEKIVKVGEYKVTFIYQKQILHTITVNIVCK